MELSLSGDFETRSEEELDVVGADKYTRHKSTDILCFAYDLNDGLGRRIWRHILPRGGRNLPPNDLIEFVHKNKGKFKLRAHNAPFEFAVWNNILTPRFKFPPLDVNQMDCSAAQAAALALPRALDNLGKAIGARVLKDQEGKAVMQRMTKPYVPKKGEVNPPKWHEKPEDFEKLWSYCLNDEAAEASASEKMPPLDNRSRRLFHLTERVNNRGIYADVKLCKIAVKFAKKYSEKISLEIPILTGGKIHTANQHAKIKTFLSEHGCELPNTQAGTIDAALRRTDLHPKAKRLLEIRQFLGKSSLAKYEAMIRMAGPDDRIRGTLLWHGASTGRLSGRGIQPQNYPARTKYSGREIEQIISVLAMDDYDFFLDVYPDVFAALSSALRGMLKASKGKTLIAADFASIEVRVLFWLARCELGLELYHAGADLYIDMASDVYGISKSLIDKLQRFLGKEVVLGSGFGLGPSTFITSCAKKGVTVTPALAKKAIYMYRNKFFEVPQFWKDLENAAIDAVTTGKCIKVGHLQFLYKNKFLWIRLPSGRKLAYYDPQVKIEESKFGPRKVLSFMAVHPKTKQWVRESIWGGKWAENVTQAVAADLMYEGMERVEANNLPVILSVHDELISEIDKDQCTVEEYEKLISVVPKWANGLPVKAEGWISERYKK